VREKQKQPKEERDTFILKVSEYKPQSTQQKGLLVNSGASAHIVTDERAFSSLQLADSRIALQLPSLYICISLFTCVRVYVYVHICMCVHMYTYMYVGV